MGLKEATAGFGASIASCSGNYELQKPKDYAYRMSRGIQNLVAHDLSGFCGQLGLASSLSFCSPLLHKDGVQ